MIFPLGIPAGAWPGGRQRPAAGALLRLRRLLPLAVLALATGLSALFLPGATAWAQVGNPCAGEGIDSRECVCHAVDDFAAVPMKMTVAFDIDGDGNYPDAYNDQRDHTTGAPVYDEATGLWVSNLEGVPLSVASWGTEPLAAADPANGVSVESGDLPSHDMVLELNDRYNELCAFSYFRENLGRVWRFGVALAGVAAAISLAWGGVAYMQDSASYGDAARIRMAMLRVLMGLAVVALALVVWNAVDGFLITHVDSWSWDQRFYDFSGLTGG